MYKLLQDLATPKFSVRKGDVADVLTWARRFDCTYTEFFIRLERGDYKQWLKKI